MANAKTGVEIYRARVGGGGHTFSSSPLASQGRIYLLSEDGDAFVIREGDRYDEISKNSLGEMSLATPAADADSLYVRTQTKLYRIRNDMQKCLPNESAQSTLVGDADFLPVVTVDGAS